MRRCDLRGSGGALGLLTTTLTPVETSPQSSLSLLHTAGLCSSGGGLSLFFFFSLVHSYWSGSGGVSSFFLPTCKYSWSVNCLYSSSLVHTAGLACGVECLPLFSSSTYSSFSLLVHLSI